MPRAAPAITAVNGGEMSPLVYGRPDLEVYQSGLALCRNFIPLPQGGVRNRPGSRYLGAAKSSTLSDKTRVIPYVSSRGVVFVLEFGNLYFRVWKNRAPVLLSGTPVEVVTPYTTAMLDGIQFVQSADTLYVCHPEAPPQVIRRTSDTAWTCTAIDFQVGPFLDEQETAITITPSGTTGTITLTASAPLFVTGSSGHIGSLWLLWAENISTVGKWEPGKSVTTGARIYDTGRFYTAANTATTGTVRPQHESGTEYDGVSATGVQWAFESSIYGIVKITAVASSTSATATVIRTLPNVLSGAATSRYQEGAWSAVNGWPGAVTFYQDRLVFGGTRFQPDTLWFSGVGDYENFIPYASTGLTTPDLAITATVSSQEVNRIHAMTQEGAGILVLTEGSEFLIAPANSGEGLSQSNIRALSQTNYGSAPITPVRAFGSTLFADGARRKLREATYDYTVDRYIAPDLTLLAEHITAAKFAWLAYAPDPHGLVWAGMQDGSLLALTYERDQQVSGWHRHQLGGTRDVAGNPPFVEWACAVPSPDGSRSDLYMVVRRRIGSTDVRTIELMDFDRALDGDIRDAFFLDCGVTWTGASSTTVTGLSHLNGATVQVLADGAVHPDRTVSSGAITLDRAATKVHVGFFSPAEMETLRIEAGAANGTAQGKLKRITKVFFRLYASALGAAGRRGGQMDAMSTRDFNQPVSGPINLYTGDVSVSWPHGHETEGQIYVRQSVPLPLNLLAVFPHVTTQD